MNNDPLGILNKKKTGSDPLGILKKKDGTSDTGVPFVDGSQESDSEAQSIGSNKGGRPPESAIGMMHPSALDPESNYYDDTPDDPTVPAKEKDYLKGTLLDNIKDVPIVGDYVFDVFDDIARAVGTGLNQSELLNSAMDVMTAGEGVTSEQLEQLIKDQEALESVQQSDEMTNLQKDYEENGGGVKGFLYAAVNNPRAILETSVSSMVAMANRSSGVAAGGIVATGAAGGSAAGGVGAVPGAVASIPFAIGAAGGVLETGLSFAEFLKEEVGDDKEFNDDNIRKVLEDDDAMKRIRSRALTRGATIGVIDALFGRVATAVGAKVLSRTGSKFATGAANTATEMVGGGTGEAVARKAVGQPMDVMEVGLEALGEGPMAAAPTATNLYQDSRKLLSPKATKAEYKVNNKAATIDQVREVIETARLDDLPEIKISISGDQETQALLEEKLADKEVKDQVDQLDLGDKDKEKVFELEKKRRKLEGNKTQAGKEARSKIEEQIKSIVSPEETKTTQDDSKNKAGVSGKEQEGGITKPTEPVETKSPEETGASRVLQEQEKEVATEEEVRDSQTENEPTQEEVDSMTEEEVAEFEEQYQEPEDVNDQEFVDEADVSEDNQPVTFEVFGEKKTGFITEKDGEKRYVSDNGRIYQESMVSNVKEIQKPTKKPVKKKPLKGAFAVAPTPEKPTVSIKQEPVKAEAPKESPVQEKKKPLKGAFSKFKENPKGAAKAVQKSLEDAGIKVTMIDDEAAFDAEVQKRGGPAGVEGLFDDNGEILINPGRIEAGWGDTVVFHEGTHPVINILRNTNKGLLDSAIKGLREAAKTNKDLAKVVEWAEREYSGEATVDDEAIVETVARLASGRISLDNIPSTLYEKLKDIINAISKAMGLGEVVSNDKKKFIELATQISETLKAGESITNIVGEENVREFKNTIEEEISITEKMTGPIGQASKGDREARKNITKVIVAPFFDKQVAGVDNIETVSKSKAYKEHVDNMRYVAREMGLKVKDDVASLGRYVNESGEEINEISTTLILDGASIDEATKFAAVMGALDPEVQESTIASEVIDLSEIDSPRHDANLYSLKVSDIDAAEKIAKSLKLQYTANPEQSTIDFLEFKKVWFNFEEFDDKIRQFDEELGKNGITYETTKYPLESRFIANNEEVERKQILEDIRREVVERQKRTGFRDIIDLAIQRNEEFIRQQSKEGQRKRYEELRNKQIALSESEQQLKPSELKELTNLYNELLPHTKKTFSNALKNYVDAKAELDAVAKEIVGDMGIASPYNVKRVGRSSIKALRWYGGKAQWLGDGARVNIVTPDPANVIPIFEALRSEYVGGIERNEKDVTDLGYPKKLLEVRTSNGTIGEFQVMTPEGYLAKDGIKDFPEGAEKLAKKSLAKVRKRLGWDIPDGVGHYFYEINRDVNIPVELRNKAIEVSNKYYDAFINENSNLTDQEFRQLAADFKYEVDNADKTNWDEGNTGNAPVSLVEYLGDSQFSKGSRDSEIASTIRELSESGWSDAEISSELQAEFGYSAQEADSIVTDAKKSKPKKSGRVERTLVKKRAYDGNVRKSVKRNLEKMGLSRKMDSWDVAETEVTKFVEKVGLDIAMDAVRNFDIRGTMAAAITYRYAQYLDQRIQSSDNPIEKAKLSEEYANLINEWGMEQEASGAYNAYMRKVLSEDKLGLSVDDKIKKFKEEFGEIPKEVEAKFRKLGKELEEARKREAELIAELKKKEEAEAIENIKKSAKRSKTKTYGKSQIREGIDDLAKALGIDPKKGQFSKGGRSKKSDVTNALIKIGLGLIQDGKADMNNVADKVGEVVESMYGDAINYEEYKSIVGNEINDLHATLSVPHSVIREFVERGIDNIDDLTRAVMDMFPGYTERQVRDAITGYGKLSTLSKDEIEKKIRRMKQIGRTVSALEDVRNKKRPKRSGLQRDKLDSEQRALVKQLREEMKDLPIDSETERQQLKTALDAAKQRIRNQIEDLTREIKTGQRIQKKNRTLQQDAELEMLIEQRDKLKLIHDQVFDNSDVEEQRKLDAAIRAARHSVEEYERRIRENDLSPKKKESTVKETPELKALRDKRDQLKEKIEQMKKAQNPPLSPEEKATNAAIRATEKSLAEVERRIANNELRASKKPSLVQQDNARLMAAKARLKTQREVLEQMQRQAGIYEEKRLQAIKDAARRRIDDLKDRIQRRDFEPVRKRKVIADDELNQIRAEKIRIEEEFQKERVKERLKNRTKAELAIDHFWDAWGLLRALRATGEMSFVLIQGLIPTISHPVQAAKSFANAVRFMGSEKKTEQWLYNIRTQDWYPMLKDSKLAITEPHAEITAREELFFSGWTDFIWNTIGRVVSGGNKAVFDKWSEFNPFKIVERGALGYLNTLRVLRFLDGVEMLESRGVDFSENPDAYKQMADVINTFTGRASLGTLEQNSEFLTKFIFSPRNWASVIKTATPWAFVHFGKMRAGADNWKPSVAQKMAIKDYSKFLGFTTSMVMLAAAGLNDDDDDETGVEFDPRSSDFMKIKVGNKRIDPWGGRIQQVVFTSRLLMDSVKKGDGRVVPLGTKFQSPTRRDVVLRMVTNKLAPSAALVNKYLDTYVDKDGVRKDLYGNEFVWDEEVVSNLYPIYWETIKELVQDDPGAMDGLLLFYAFFGGGIQVYDDKKKKKSGPPKSPKPPSAPKPPKPTK